MLADVFTRSMLSCEITFKNLTQVGENAHNNERFGLKTPTLAETLHRLMRSHLPFGRDYDVYFYVVYEDLKDFVFSRTTWKSDFSNITLFFADEGTP